MKVRPTEGEEAEIMKLPHEIETLLDSMFREMPRDVEYITRIEYFLNTTTSGTKGLFGVLVRMHQIDYGTKMPMPDNDKMMDMPIFLSYMLLAKTRRLRYNGAEGTHRTADLIQEALELFALYENRPFPYVYDINQLLRKGPSKKGR